MGRADGNQSGLYFILEAVGLGWMIAKSPTHSSMAFLPYNRLTGSYVPASWSWRLGLRNGQGIRPAKRYLLEQNL